MSQEEQDLLLGKTMREKAEAQKKLDQLTAKANQIGDRLQALGALLRYSPSDVRFEGVSTNVKYVTANSPSFNTGEVNGKEIAELTSAIRDAMEELERVNQRAAKLGL